MGELLSGFDREFKQIDKRSRALVALVDETWLFKKPRDVPHSMAAFSCGEYILRSAAMFEMTFGGITTRLWDDPFEWTLPEKMADHESINRYMDEVEATRLKGFAFFTSDDELAREMPSPEKLRPIISIFLDTLAKAAHYQGRAFAVFQMISDEKLPRI